MQTINNHQQKNISLVITVIASIIFLLFPIFSSPDFSWDFHFIHIVPFQQSFLAYVFSLAFFLLNWFYFLPNLYFQRKYTSYILLLLLFFGIVTYLPKIITNDFNSAPGGPPPFEGRPQPYFLLPIQNTFQFLFAFVASLLLATRRRLRQIEQQKLEVELAYLKAQINPHFFFNSLNSIYSLVLQKSDEAPDALLHLSNMMRYILEDDKDDFIELQKEVDFINDYVSLQSYRMPKDSSVSINVAIDGCQNTLVAPMLYASFVENAFKYGVNPNEEGEINIEITTNEEREIVFSCSNRIVSRKQIKQVNSNGIGITNTKHRLNNLYLGNYSLTIQEQNNIYSVRLILPFK